MLQGTHHRGADRDDAPAPRLRFLDRGDGRPGDEIGLVQGKLAAADTQPAFKITGDGKQQWGQGGTAALDTDLFRLSAGQLKTSGGLVAAGNLVARQAAVSQIYLGDLGDARPSVAFGSSANPSLRATSSDDLGFFGTNLYIGAALDTALFRAAAAILACNGAVTAKQLAARVGADLAATSGAITVTNGIHRVTSVPGSSISTINGGYDGAIVTLINRTGAVLNLATGGNIQMATNPTYLAVNAARMLVFNALEPAWQVTGG